MPDNGAIRALGDPVLRTPCAEVVDFDQRLDKLVQEMFERMYAARGVGLAANQIGVGLSVFVYDCPDDDGVNRVGHLVNPTMEYNHGERVTESEGCLSVPGHYFDTERYAETALTGYDTSGNPVRVAGTGYFARCLQHEFDHLNGRLYIDRLTGAERRKAFRKLREQLAEPVR